MDRPIITLIAAASAIVLGASAAAQERTRFQVGVTAATGLSDLKEKIEYNNPTVEFESFSPLGLSAAVFRELAGGWTLGATIGPMIAAGGDASFLIVPIGLEGRWVAGQAGGTKVYLRAGLEKAIVSGDFVANSSIGGVLGIAIDFGDSPRNNWGVDFAYHSTPVAVPPAPGSRKPEQTARPFQAVFGVHFTF